MPSSDTSTRYQQGALTGNLITIEIAGKVIGLIQSLQAQEDFGLQPVSGMGQVTPVEHTPSVSRINLSCETIYISPGAAAMAGSPGVYAKSESTLPDRIPQESSTVAWTLEGSKTEANPGVIPSTAVDVLKGAVFNIVIYKKSGGTNASGIVRTYIDCSYAGGSISFQKHQIVMQSATFMAIDYSDASTPPKAFTRSQTA